MHLSVLLLPGLEMLEKVANVDCAYNMTPEELYAKIAQSDALIVRSATKVRRLACAC
jgi:D-3-phosphoglycerate dehydrogenase